MKSVLMSIKPEYCELIANGKKTIEVRKNRPKLETPFKCYIYCTSVKNLSLKEYVEIHSKTGGVVDNWNGKVIGEFLCDSILSNCEMANADIAEQQGKVKREDLFKYANGKELYGWHISDLVIYDTPKELREFSAYTKDKCPANLNGVCLDRTQNDVVHCKNLGCPHKKLKRPPQSWCYVESEVEGE